MRTIAVERKRDTIFVQFEEKIIGCCHETDERAGFFLSLNGKEGTVNTRFLHQSCDRGKAKGETDLVVSSGEGWRDHLVIS